MPRFGALAVALSLAPALAACTAHAPDIGRQAVDTKLVTQSVDREPEPIPEAGTDAEAIALAMDRIRDGATDEGGLDWKNSADGAQGSIMQVTASSSDEKAACRRFLTTRERFDGIGLLRGEACRDGAGAWRVTSLANV